MSSSVYRRSIGRPEMVVKGPVRSGVFLSVGASTSRSHRVLADSAAGSVETGFMTANYICSNNLWAGSPGRPGGTR
jgi:hypothetical protein